MAAAYENKFGRKGGRGWRPWLLIPKIICVALLLGGLVSAGILMAGADASDLQAWGERLESVSQLFIQLIVPAAIGTLVFGILLLVQHWRVFWRQRWFQVKSAALVVTLPPLHLWARGLMGKMRSELEAGRVPAEEAGQFMLVLGLAVAAVLLTIWLGRHKPRLGQGARVAAGDALPAQQAD